MPRARAGGAGASGADAVDDGGATLAAMASLSVAAADSGESTPARAAPSGRAARTPSSPAAAPDTPQTPGTRTLLPPSPGPLELRSPAEGAKVHGALTVTFQSVSACAKGKIVCDFKVQVLKFTPDKDEACQSKLAIRLGDVKLFNAEPKKLKTLKLTLKEGVAGIVVTSPGDALPPGSDARECSFVFATQAKFDEVVEDLQAALVFRPGVYDTDFEKLSDTPVGKGGNGICYLVRRRGAAAGSTTYVVKELLGGGDLQKEVDFMKALGSCEFITRFEAYYREPDGNGVIQHLVMEYMEGGQLMEDLLLKRMKLRAAGAELMNGDEIRVLTWRLLKALEYMHCKKKIMHRDLKPENILMARLGSDKCGDPASAMVCDFGHSKILAKSTHTKNMGTVAYAAPEIIFSGKSSETSKGRDKDEAGNLVAGHSFPSDMWSVGVTLYVMLAQVFPFDTADPADHAAVKLVREKVMLGLVGTAAQRLVQPGSPHAAVYATRDENACELMVQLLQRDPKLRPTAADALAHAWFAGMVGAGKR